MSTITTKSARTTDIVATLSGRHEPEAVALMILDAIPILAPQAQKALKQIAREPYSFARTTFPMPVKTDRPVHVLAELIRTDGGVSPRVHGIDDTNGVQLLLETARATKLIDKRAMNRLERQILKVERMFATYQEHKAICENGRFAKTAFAAELTESQLTDPATLAFVAYYTANLGRRSRFIPVAGDKQDRAFDEVAHTLFQQLSPATTNWYAIAHVFPRADVLGHLTAAEKFDLLGRAQQTLYTAATQLQKLVATNTVDLNRMIVKQGNDSATWNAVAGAFNRARDYIIDTIYAMNMPQIFDRWLPGKALRLMAADLVWSRTVQGEGLEPDTKIWQALPKPWDVVLGNASCDRAMIDHAIKTMNLEGKVGGWTAARPRTAVSAWVPTPDLVCGVAISNPYIAEWMRKHGIFSANPKFT